MFFGFRDKKYLGIASQDWTLLYRIYHITKVRSRQAVKLPAVQPIVMWTPALGRIGEKQVWKKNQNIFMF